MNEAVIRYMRYGVITEIVRIEYPYNDFATWRWRVCTATFCFPHITWHEHSDPVEALNIALAFLTRARLDGKQLVTHTVAHFINQYQGQLEWQPDSTR